MIIAVDAEGRVTLRDPDNFRAFKIADELGQGPAKLADALTGLATLTADGEAAWVSMAGVGGLLPQPPTAAWRASFEGMLAFARKHGWVNDADGTVRAHIEATGE